MILHQVEKQDNRKQSCFGISSSTNSAIVSIARTYSPTVKGLYLHSHILTIAFVILNRRTYVRKT